MTEFLIGAGVLMTLLVVVGGLFYATLKALTYFAYDGNMLKAFLWGLPFIALILGAVMAACYAIGASITGVQ